MAGSGNRSGRPWCTPPVLLSGSAWHGAAASLLLLTMDEEQLSLTLGPGKKARKHEL